jgi:cytidylate kinase
LEAARLLGADYIDHQILAQAARRTGAPVEEVAQKDERAVRGRERVARFFQNFLEKSAAAGSAGDPFLGPTGIEMLMSRTMAEAAAPSTTRTEQLNDARYLEVVTAVIRDEARGGNCVLIGRGAHVILKDDPNALHVYLVSSAEKRVAEIMRRERLAEPAAQKFVKEQEEARAAFYKKMFKVQPEDPMLYHLFLNVDRLGPDHCARIVAEAARELVRTPAPV